MEEIVDFSQHLLKFLRQANEPDINLKTKDYEGTFNGSIVKASFGAGNPARIPWLALLRGDQKVLKGIYPVYLYYKQQQLLILAYGVSETNEPATKWDVAAETVEDFFETRFSIKPKRYGSSYVYSNYPIDRRQENFGLNSTLVNDDIRKLTNFYNNKIFGDIFSKGNTTKKRETPKQQPIASNPQEKMKTTMQKIPFDYKKLIADIKNAHLSYSDNYILRFVCSLCTKPFVILTGLAGSGKTKLAQAFAKWICEEEEQICIVPVGADWTNREPLLGYPNALGKEDYVFPESGVLELILQAHQNPHQPYFLILDEMNLSHVERYFADFLSAMESEEKICLHAGTSNWNRNQPLEVPPKIMLPPNLFIIGTVNIDETTYMFSPKVLDRANVIEFRVSENEMLKYLKLNNGLKLSELKGAGAAMAEDFIQIALDKTTFGTNKNLNDVLISFFKKLQKVGAEFGYRSATEIIRFVAIVNKLKPNWTDNEIADAIIMQKLLPKVHGSRRKLEPVLKALGELCLHDSKDEDKDKDKRIDDLLDPTKEMKEKDDRVKYPLALEKIRRMYQGLMDNGFTSYAEA